MTWAFVRKAVANNSGVTAAVPVTFSGSVAAGNLVTVRIASANTIAINSITDSGGNTYTLAKAVSGSGGVNNAIYYSVITTGGTLTVTVNFASSSNLSTIEVDEYSFATGTLSVPSTNGLDSSGTTSTPDAGVVTWTGNAMVVGSLSVAGTNTITPGTGFSTRTNTNGSPGVSYGLYTEDALNTGAGTIDVIFTAGSAVTGYGVTGAVFQTTGDTSSITPSPSSAATGGGNVTFTLTGSGTAWTGGTLATLSGGTGASIVSQSIAGQIITVVVNVGTTAATLTFGDTTDSLTTTVSITLGLPGIPQTPSCTAGNTQNVLNWTAPSSGGTVATYNVYRGTTPGGESGTPIATGITLLTYPDTGLTNGTTYYYKIAAVNATGVGTKSSEVFGTPAATGVSNLTAVQALAALGVLAHTVQPPFLTEGQTGIFVINNQLLIPLSAYNLALGAALINGADSNNVYLGFVEGDPGSGVGSGGTAVGSAGVSGGGTGILTAAQALAALGALMHSVQPPYLTQTSTGIYSQANQLVVPLSTYNLALGSGLVNSVDSNYVYLGLNIGDPASGA